MKTERIDGIDYLIGSQAHVVAQQRRKARQDAIRAQQLQTNVRMIRASEPLDRVRNDANATIFLARELLYVRAQVERVIYDQLKARDFIPIDTSIPRGAQSYSTQLVDQKGTAKISHDLAGDSPRADVSKVEDLRKLVNIRGSYAFSVQDLEYSAFSGTSLPRERALACAEMIARGLDQVGRSGDVPTGLTGLFNDANVTLATLPNGEWDTTASPDEILADLAYIEQTIIAAARDNQPAGYKLVLPTSFEGVLSTTRIASNSDLTVKEFFLKKARIITAIERWVKLDTAVAPDTASARPMGVCYPQDQQTLFWPIPISYEEQPPEVRNFEWLVNARARCGGVDVRRPYQMLYFQNID